MHYPPFHWFPSFLSLTLGILGALLCVQTAAAATLTWTNPTTVSISSPSSTLTIASGSLADSFVVHATSVLVGVSSSTGGSFSLTASNSDLTVNSSAGGGTASTSCTSGTASTTITQSTGSATYTITPTGSVCTSNSGGNGTTAGPTVGVSAGYLLAPTSTATSTPSAAPSSSPPSPASLSSLEATLASLEAKLQALVEEAAQRGIAVPLSGRTGTASSFSFTRNLSLWSRGADVQALQKFLAQRAAGPAGRALASHGVTRTFGYLTLHALMEYQRSIGLSASGYFGPMTRAKVAARPQSP